MTKIETLGRRPLAGGVADTLEMRPSPRAKYGRSRSNGMSMITEIHQKKCTLHVPPFMVTGTDTERSTIYDFLFLVRRNNGFLRKKTTAMWPKIAIFPISVYITLAEGVPCGIL